MNILSLSTPISARSRRSIARIGVIPLMTSMAAVAALCAPQRADAKEVIVMITGTVTSGTDQTGVFLKGDLTNQGFSLVYTFDDTIGGCPGSTIYSCIQNLDGTTEADNPVVSAVLRIAGKSFTYGSLRATYTLNGSYAFRRFNYGGCGVFLGFNESETYTPK